MNTIFLRQISRVFFLFVLSSLVAHATIVRGTVTDELGRPVTGATVVLIQQGKIIQSQNTSGDGTFQFSNGKSGYFFLIASGKSFRQISTPSFSAGRLDVVERKLVLEPEWVREQIVVTPTGNPIPTAQTGASVEVLDTLALANREDIVAAMRLQPGVSVVQTGQRGSVTSMFVRGGESVANKVLFDGVSAADLGGRFDLGTVSTTGLESVELYRGANSALFGSDAAGGVLQFATVHGTTSSPTLTLTQEDGNFNNFLYAAQLGGTRHKLDYYGSFTRLDAGNAIPVDKYHDATSVANIGWQHSGSLGFRATGRYQVSATGIPNAYNFYKLSDDRKEGDQDLYVGGLIHWTPRTTFDNKVQYSLMRKREQSQQWNPPAGILTNGNYYGRPVNICGANDYCASGQALLNYSVANYGVYPNRLDLISNADRLSYQGTYARSAHFGVYGGFRYEYERSKESEPAYFYMPNPVDRTNYGYSLLLSGDLRERFFYSLGSGMERNNLYGTEWTPRASVAWYLRRPAKGKAHGTRINFNFGKAVREPTLTDQDGSLYTFLANNGGQAQIARYHIDQLSAPTARDFDGGFEQSFLSQHILWRTTYFHNQYGRQIESVSASLIPELLPNLTTLQQQQLETFLLSTGAYALSINSQAMRAQGIETQVQSGIGQRIFMRAGYTYLDAVIQRSFDSDNTQGAFIYKYNGVIPVGINGPLTGARPFRRPPHTGFALLTYADRRYAGTLTATFASRSDDSTFLAYSDLNQGNSLLLPNRNLDHGWLRLDLGGSVQVDSHFSLYTQLDNLTSNQHIAPIGYPSMPFTFRTGIRYAMGKTIH